MKKTANGGNFGIQLSENNLSDLDFADDIALIGKDQAIFQNLTSNLVNYGKRFDLRRKDKDHDS